jgi:hypothetical protein
MSYLITKLFCLLVLCLIIPLVLSAQPVISLYDELTELYPDSVINEGMKEYTIDAARGTITGIHILLTGMDSGAVLKFRMVQQNRPVVEARWYRMIDVPVEENTGLDSRTEKFSGKINPYVIRRAPFRIFEALDPASSPMVIDKPTIAMRAEIPISTDATVNENKYEIIIDIGNYSEKLHWIVNVRQAVIPSLKHSTISYVNWHSLGNICSDHGVEIWTEPFWNMLSEYARLMVRGRQNTFWLLWNDFFNFDSVGHMTMFHRQRLERYVKVFMDEGLQKIQGCPFTFRESWSTDAMYVIPTQYKIPAASEEGLKQIERMADRIYSAIEENHWEKKWMQGIFDEPTDEYVDRYKTVVEVFRKHMPGIPIIEATMTTKLSGYIDILCPQVQEYQKEQEFYEQRKTAGDRVWVYTCLVPGGPWLNRLLDQERLRQVYFGWGCARYNLNGYLHWGFNMHRAGQDPFQQSAIQHYEGEENNFLPAGDTHIIYQRKNGPISGQRFEAVRIGIEDFELLTQLKAKHTALADMLIKRIFRAFDDYSKDIAEYRNTKRLLLESLDTK